MVDRWDCSDAGHRKRFTIRRNGVEVASRKARNCWWPFVLRDLGFLGWMESDLAYGDPGNPTLNNLPQTDVFVGALDDPMRAPIRLLAKGAGPHGEATDRGACMRRVAGPGRIELAEVDPTGRDLGAHVIRNILTDPSWSPAGFTWCEDGAFTGDGLPLTGLPGARFVDPVRHPTASGVTAVLVQMGDGRWAIGVLTVGGWPYFVYPPSGPVSGTGQVLLGPPRWAEFDGEMRLLTQRAVVGERAWQAVSMRPGDLDSLRTEWAEADGHVRFPVIA